MEVDPQLLVCILHRLEENTELRQKLLQSSALTSDLEIDVENILARLSDYASEIPRSIAGPKKVRIYMAACMDIIHSGHFNCMRQARALGDELVVGVISDEEIRRCKGPPVMAQDERYAMAAACKWADTVINGVEYYVTPEILQRAGCDYVVHGDDLAIRKDTGTDAYADVRQAGLLKVVKRTEGISTTEMVGKMLLMTQGETIESESLPASQISHSPSASKFLATARRITQFSSNKSPGPEDKIVYIDGTFDMLHKGHVETLKKAKELGDYLIVGVHDDKTANFHKGKNYPIMNLHERTLNLLAMRYVDDVIMGAPWEVTQDMIKTLNIGLVVQGSNHKNASDENPSEDPYRVAKELGIYTEVESETMINTEDIVDRIVANRLQYVQRNKRMVENEVNYYAHKQYVAEI